MLTTTLTFVLTLTLTLTLTLDGAEGSGNTCQRIPVTESIVKEMVVRNLPVSCTEEVELFKCEGQCESTVSPSVSHRRGFRKNCRCCKESEMTMRSVNLTRCYYNGLLQHGFHGATDVGFIRGCRCLPCTN